MKLYTLVKSEYFNRDYEKAKRLFKERAEKLKAASEIVFYLPEKDMFLSGIEAYGWVLKTVMNDAVANGSTSKETIADFENIVVFTNDDNIFNSIRVMVLNNVLNPFEIIVHDYDYDGIDGEENTMTLNMKERGNIAPWPDGFFDKFETILSELLREKPEYVKLKI